MTKPVLVGVDGSAASAAALRWALRHAQSRGARVRAVYAWGNPLVSYVPPALGGTSAPPAELMAKAALDGAYEFVRQAGVDTSAVEVAAIEGNPSRVLIDEGAGAEMIVVGTRGYSALHGLLLGSTASQLSHHALVPVVIVPETVD